jgi:hypothetical protein
MQPTAGVERTECRGDAGWGLFADPMNPVPKAMTNETPQGHFTTEGFRAGCGRRTASSHCMRRRRT